MITLHLLKLLANNGFGTIALTGEEEDADLFFEKLPLDKDGLYIVSRGFPLTRSARTTQQFDIYARLENDVAGAKKLEEVLEFMESAYGTVCELPEVPPISTAKYTNVAIRPTSNIQSAGLDDNDRIIWVISGQVSYKKEGE